MSFGTLFVAELRASSRRIRTFAVRVLFGVILLLIIWVQFFDRSAAGPGIMLREATGWAISGIAREIFRGLAYLEIIAVALLTPVVVAPTIAEKTRRKTLDPLLCSSLSSAEIVLGSLASRVVFVLSFASIACPVLVLLTLLGGIDPELVLAITCLTSGIAVCLGGLSISISTLAREPFEAIIGSYLAIAAFLALSPLLERVVLPELPSVYAGLGPIPGWLSELTLFMPRKGVGGPAALLRISGMMTILGSGFTLVGIVLLRPAARMKGERVRRHAPKLTRVVARPECGDDPMRWKELRFGRRLGRVGTATRAIVAFAILLATMETARRALPSFRELFEYGYGLDGREGLTREFGDYVRVAGLVASLIAILGVAVAAAGSITSERERDTWTNLSSSPLEGYEILSAKRSGASRKMRPAMILASAVWLTGGLSGAVHPFGVAASLVALWAYVAFAAALGTFFSLHLKSTTRAVVAAVVVLLLCEIGPIFCCSPVLGNETATSGMIPYILYLIPMSYGEVHSLIEGSAIPAIGHVNSSMIVSYGCSVLFYALFALVLNMSSSATYDLALDRPKRDAPSR